MLQYFGFITSVIYMVLEIKQHRAMWILGIISSLVYTIVFARVELYAAMALQVYYFFISIYGWFEWRRSKDVLAGNQNENENEKRSKEEIFIRRLSWKLIIVSLICGVVIWVILSQLLSSCTGDPNPEIDSLVTSLSIEATYWLSRAHIEQWYLWMLANSIAVFLYFTQSMYPTALLYLLYLVTAIYGYIHWKKKGIILK